MSIKEKRETPNETRRESAEADSGLPTEKGFLLQLTHGTSPTLTPFAGRLEHLASGQRLRFASFKEFQAAVSHLLGAPKRPRGADPD